MKALLIVDVQNDFLPGGALAIENGNQVIPIINELQKKFEVILASKDWHPPNHISFAETHGKEPGETIESHGHIQELWPIHCVEGTEGADFHPSLNREKIQKVFLKGTDPSIDSYSAFYDNSHHHSTGLNEYLKENRIDHIFIVGLATDYCVKFSTLDAIKSGIKTTVVIDGCRGVDLNPGDVDHAIEEMKKAGAEFITSKEILK